MCMPFWTVDAVGGPCCHGGKDASVCLFDLLMQLVVLFGTEAKTRVYVFFACWSTWWALLARRQGRVCVPFWPVDVGGGLCWHEGKDACVCLFGLLTSWWVLFAWRKGRVCVPFWVVGVDRGSCWHGGKDACVYLFGLLMQLVGLVGTEERTRVYTFLAC